MSEANDGREGSVTPITIPAALVAALEATSSAAQSLPLEFQAIQTASTAEQRTAAVATFRTNLEGFLRTIDTVAELTQQVSEIPEEMRTMFRKLVDKQRENRAAMLTKLEEEERAFALARGQIGKS